MTTIKRCKVMFGALLRYSFPLILTTLFLSAVNLTDMGIAGRFLGTDEATGVGVGGQIGYLFFNAGVGLSCGATIFISKQKGEGKTEFCKTALTAAMICAVFGGIAGIILGLFPALFPKLLATPANVLPYAAAYLRITAITVPIFCLFQCAVSVLNGLGDTVTPMLLTGGYALINFGLTLLFAWKFTTVESIALAGAISAALILIASAAVLIPRLFPKQRPSIRFSMSDLKDLLKLGVPLCLLNLIATLSFWGITRIVHAAPEEIAVAQSGAHSLVVRLTNFILLPQRALATGISALTARAAGSKKPAYFTAIRTDGIILGLAVGLPAFLFVLFFPEFLLQNFGTAEFAEVGATYLRFAALDFLILPFVSGAYGSVDGQGETKVSMTVNVIASVFIRVPLACLLSFPCGLGFTGVGIALPVTTLLSVCGIAIWKRKLLFKKPHPQNIFAT